MHIDTLALVGVGLIGGSVGLAARKRGVADRILGVGNRPEVLQRALARGAVDEVRPDVRSLADADVVLFCTPVDRIAAQIPDIFGNERPTRWQPIIRPMHTCLSLILTKQFAGSLSKRSAIVRC